ncbi:MAG TPA: CARDB domain-containing protein, partial [Longilinea sp.]|nr:CARDB domain-containing protein [Longilinea sp.]
RLSGFLIIFLVAGLITAQPILMAQAAPLHTVTVTPASTTLSGLPGQVVSYSITLANDDVSDVTVNISASSINGWTTQPNVTSLTVPASGSASMTVNVAIPALAGVGANDIAYITFTDGASLNTSISLTTSVVAPIPTTYTRPLITIESYSVNNSSITPGQSFTLSLTLRNQGSAPANNIIVSFSGESFFPNNSGGMIVTSSMAAGTSQGISQSMVASSSLTGQTMGTTTVHVAYNDAGGTPYTADFTIALDLSSPVYSGYTGPTRTPTTMARPQFIVTGYETDIDPLQPGSMFELTLHVQNMGSESARSVSLIFGGGSGTADTQSTPQSGVSGSGADLGTFAPLDSSNVVFLGDVSAGQIVNVDQRLVVNVSANPGAYTLRLSFVGTDMRGNRVVDDQVITLLVYSLPNVDVSFYMDPSPIMAGMDNVLPLQISNLGRRSTVLGNMTVTASDDSIISNGTMLVGTLDAGGYFTLDASIMPIQEGPLELNIEINYTDDFNELRTINQTLEIEVMPAADMGPMLDENGNPIEGTITGGGGGDPSMGIGTEETFWQKVGRFFLGLIGLDSSVPAPAVTIDTAPTETAPVTPVKG